MKKKAIFFTIDAIIAIGIALILLVPTLIYLSKNIDYANQDAKIFAQDALLALEKSGALSKPNDTQIRSYINATPSQLCINISLYNFSETSYIKPGCNMSDIKQVSAATRVFVSSYNASPTSAKALVWHNE